MPLAGSNPALSASCYPISTGKKMRPLRTAVLALALVPGIALAQTSLDEYLAIRKQNGITQAATTAALTTFVGDRVFEIQGVVSGIISAGGKTTLILMNPDGVDLYLATKDVPGWLTAANVSARLIVKASRAGETAQIDSELIAAWPESDVAAYDAKLRAAAEAKLKAEAQARAAAEAKRQRSKGSRGGDRPPPLPGDLPSMTQAAAGEPQFSPETLKSIPKYSDYIRSVNPRLSSGQADEIATAIVGYSVRYGVDPRLVLALVQAESDFRPATTSHKGAMGLGQIMPDEKERFNLTSAYDTTQNLYATVRLLRENIERYSKTHGDSWDTIILSLAGYNAGNGAVKKYGGQVPPYKETQNYVRRVIAAYKAFCGLKD